MLLGSFCVKIVHQLVETVSSFHLSFSAFQTDQKVDIYRPVDKVDISLNFS